jgi:anti-sigma factor RsiW
MTNEDQVEFDYVDSLLPWFVSGKLAPEDILLVERALAEVPELRMRHDLILEERSAVVAVNESLGAPSARALEKLLARLESVPAGAPKSRNFGAGSWLAARFSAWQPRSLAWAGMAVVLVAIIEAGLLAIMFSGAAQKGTTYWTVSVAKKTAEQDGAFVMIAFVPDATAAQIMAFLEAHKASIIDGPVAGGIFRIRVSDKALTTKDLGAIVGFLRNESTIVRFVAPTT